MSLIGKLEDVHLRDLLALIAGRRMSGKLSLRTEGEGGAILFRRGSIVAAVSSRDPQAIGSLLVAERHISERDLHEALELHKQGLVGGRLTQVLVKQGAVSARVLETVVQRKVRRVIEDLLEWTSGYFQFEPGRVEDQGEIVIDPADFVEVARLAGDEESEERPEAAPGSRDPDRSPVEAAEEEIPPEDLLELEPPGPFVSGEDTLEIFAAARVDLRRGILFVLRYGDFCEMATFGVAGTRPGSDGKGELRISRQAPSILRDAAESGTTIRGPLEDGDGNRALVERLGDGWPSEAIAIPAVIEGRTVLVFYADGIPEDRKAGVVLRLERAMGEVATGMEDDLVRRRQGLIHGPFADDQLAPLDEPARADTFATLSNKIDRLIQQNESLLREYRLREQSFWHLAHHDPLTGLPNRFLFRELLVKEVAHTRQEGDLLAVAIFNIDHFKDVNDHLGDSFGDELLTDVAARISKIVRAEDTLARLGGDEFALVIPKITDVDNAMLVVRRVFDAFREPFRVGQNEILLSLSMGVSFYPEDGHATGELVLNAESALRRAKEAGRNNFQVFAPPMNEWAQVRMELAQDLRRSIASSDGLSLLFQPILAIDSGRRLGAEALLRWRPPERQPVEAHTLIELAEDTGQMPALGEWILRHACAECALWQETGHGIPVWVNVSIRQFQAGGLVEAVMRALHETGLPPELLRLEVTESVAALNVPNVRESLDRLDKLGVAVVLDDFGAGYSSLSYLMRFSVTGLKIDQSFVAGVLDRQEARAVVAASISLGQSLDLDVVAEGVETQEQMDYLRDHGCPFIQGRFLVEPLTSEAFVRFLRGELETGDPTGLPSVESSKA